MPEVIIGSPNQNMMAVNNSGAVPIAGYRDGVIYPFLVDDFGGITIGTPNAAYEFTYLTSGTATGVTGSAIGSIWQTIGVGSLAQSLTWDNDLITNVGSWGT